MVESARELAGQAPQCWAVCAGGVVLVGRTTASGQRRASAGTARGVSLKRRTTGWNSKTPLHQVEVDHHLLVSDSAPHATWHDVLELFAQANAEPAVEAMREAPQEEPQIHVARSFAVGDTSDTEGGDEGGVCGAEVRQWKALLPFVRRRSGEEGWRRVPSGTRRMTSSSSSRDTELAVDSLLMGAVDMLMGASSSST